MTELGHVTFDRSREALPALRNGKKRLNFVGLERVRSGLSIANVKLTADDAANRADSRQVAQRGEEPHRTFRAINLTEMSIGGKERLALAKARHTLPLGTETAQDASLMRK